MSREEKPRPVGINHVAIEVGDLEEALDFYRDIFQFELRGRSDGMAFLDLGDQFVAIAETPDAEETVDGHRHLGLAVDDAEAVEERLQELDIELIGGSSTEFRDPWGNWIQVVDYREIQFTKADHVSEGMGIGHLVKTEAALQELREKGLLED